jgi:hypothetical protein
MFAYNRKDILKHPGRQSTGVRVVAGTMIAVGQKERSLVGLDLMHRGVCEFER